MSVVASSRSARRRWRWSTALAFWIFVGPLMAGLVVFTAVPIVWGFLLSLQDARGTIYGQRWIGFTNYANILNDPAFVDSLRTICIFAVLIVPTTFAVGLGLALLVNSARRGQAFFRSVVLRADGLFVRVRFAHLADGAVQRGAVWHRQHHLEHVLRRQPDCLDVLVALPLGGAGDGAALAAAGAADDSVSVGAAADSEHAIRGGAGDGATRSRLRTGRRWRSPAGSRLGLARKHSCRESHIGFGWPVGATNRRWA